MPPVSKALAKLDASKLDEMSFVKMYKLTQAVTDMQTLALPRSGGSKGGALESHECHSEPAVLFFCRFR